MSAELINMIDGMLRRLKRFGYLKDSIKFQDLLYRYDEDLFISMSKTHHCLYHIITPSSTFRQSNRTWPSIQFTRF